MIDFQAMMGNAPNPYMVVNRDLRFVWVNAAYERATMRPSGELLGRLLFEAFPPQNEKAHRLLSDSITRAFETGEVDELAFIEYPIRNANGSMETHYWSATHTPFRNQAGRVDKVLQHTVNITELHKLRRMRDSMGIIDRAKAVEQRFADATEELARMRSLLEQAPGFTAVLSGPEHSYVFANQAYHTLLGHRPLAGRTIREVIPEIEEQGFQRVFDEVYATGRVYHGKRQRFVFHDEGSAPRETYLEFVFQPILGADGKTTGILVQGHDISEQVEAEERQQILINELNHRVKNTLAVVQGLA